MGLAGKMIDLHAEQIDLHASSIQELNNDDTAKLSASLETAF